MGRNRLIFSPHDGILSASYLSVIEIAMISRGFVDVLHNSGEAVVSGDVGGSVRRLNNTFEHEGDDGMMSDAAAASWPSLQGRSHENLLQELLAATVSGMRNERGVRIGSNLVFSPSAPPHHFSHTLSVRC